MYPSFFSLSRHSFVSGYGCAKSQFLFHTPMSFSMIPGCDGIPNASSTASNASLRSLYSFVMNAVSNCSTNSENPILGRRKLYVCRSGLFVPCSTSVPQKSNSIVVFPAIRRRISGWFLMVLVLGLSCFLLCGIGSFLYCFFCVLGVWR